MRASGLTIFYVSDLVNRLLQVAEEAKAITLANREDLLKIKVSLLVAPGPEDKEREEVVNCLTSPMDSLESLKEFCEKMGERRFRQIFVRINLHLHNTYNTKPDGQTPVSE